MQSRIPIYLIKTFENNVLNTHTHTSCRVRKNNNQTKIMILAKVFASKKQSTSKHDIYLHIFFFLDISTRVHTILCRI